jgi:hypothetical protein
MLQTTKVNGYDAIIFDGMMQISVPDIEIAHSIIMKLAEFIVSKEISLLRISIPDKVFLIDSPSQNDIRFRLEDNEKLMLN